MEIEYRLDQIDDVARQILPQLKNSIIRLEGVMGAGKTTLIKALANKIGLVDAVSSPTFSVVNTYLTHSDETIYHFDFYRIESPEEALDFGVEEYFDSGFLCFLEWSERIGPLLPQQYSTLELEVLNENTRKLRLIHN